MRKVEFTDATSNIIYGYFHQFSTEYEELSDGVGQYATAIIEDTNGHLHNVAIDNIIFLRADYNNEKFERHKLEHGF